MPLIDDTKTKLTLSSVTVHICITFMLLISNINRGRINKKNHGRTAILLFVGMPQINLIGLKFEFILKMFSLNLFSFQKNFKKN